MSSSTTEELRLERHTAGRQSAVLGESHYKNDILILVPDQNNGAMIGRLHWTDEIRFNFILLGAGPGTRFCLLRRVMVHGDRRAAGRPHRGINHSPGSYMSASHVPER